MHIKRILVVRFSSLGDIILITAFIRELKKQFPNAAIDFLTSTTFSGVLENNPHLSEIIQFNRKGKSTDLNQIVTDCRKKNYDLVFDAHRSLRSRLFILKLYGLKSFFKKNIIRIDKRSLKRNLLLVFKINQFDKIVSQRQAYCQLLNDVLPFNDYNTETELFPAVKHEKKILKILSNHNFIPKEFIAIGPGASFAGKCWSKENYLKLITVLIQQKQKIVIIGGNNEPETNWIAKNAIQEGVLNLAGKLSYLESAALLKAARITICNDSAIMHFSEAVKTPVLSIFGPTAKEFGFGPFLDASHLIEIDLPCRPCSRNGKGKCTNKVERQCLNNIDVDAVVKFINF
ncbi:MAG: glycosyltransferase family 9 protein [Deltaproteobacteria bacterium]|jgi:heptosyltransferase II|nr:glycosyltransferase family 9 protein [Deltaproteobacteria bacterium]MBT4526541.1 glycosyltransferase family 9 protein [Deltaproteobacteria bacterium]